MKTKTKNLILAILVLIVASSIPAIIFGKWLEAIIFNICHLLIRQQFEKQYHHIIPAMCRIITAAVMFFGVSFVLPLELSLMSAIPINYFISWVGFIKKTSDDFEIKCNDLEDKLDKILAELKEYKNVDLYKMSLEELKQYGASKGLSEVQTNILGYRIIDNLKISQICEYYNYGRTTIKYHLGQIKKKLGLTDI